MWKQAAVTLMAILTGSAYATDVEFEVIGGSDSPVIGRDHPGSADNRFGYEGGTAVKIDGVYHLVMSEMYRPRLWDGMRFGHWVSRDRLHWDRIGTLASFQGGKEPDGGVPNAWSPMVVWDDADNRWNLFHVQYRWNRPGEPGGQHEGTIWRSRSTVPGRNGIAGPYQDVAVVLRPDAASEKWEGQQGTDSFYPYRVGEKWYALYGSHNHAPLGPWLVGTATAPALAGPWTRVPSLNPAPIEPVFIENPIVLRDDDGTYLAVYDSDATAKDGHYHEDGRTIGYTSSPDGIHWRPGRKFDILPPGKARDIRTPLGLIPEGAGRFTLFYTARRTAADFWDVGFVELRRKS